MTAQALQKTKADVVNEAAIKTGHIEDGIYFGLDEDAYHQDEALGSSDHRKLLENPCDYWYESPLNPNRPPEKDTPALLRGRAMHKLVLEGAHAFDQAFMRIDHTDAMSPAEKAAMTKATNKLAELHNKQTLPADTYDRVILAGAMISKNPKLSGAFTNGIPEVSIFWTRDGIRRKARIDYLKPRGIGDLKSIANTREISFPKACLNNIATYGYPIQAQLYLEARAKIAEFFRDGLFYPTKFGNRSQPVYDFLRKVAETKEFAWQWVFIQSEGAPVTWSSVLSPKNPILEVAKRQIDLATDNYKRFLDHFGRSQMWVLEEAPTELDINDLPAWWAR